jgi:hypothetical protein
VKPRSRVFGTVFVFLWFSCVGALALAQAQPVDLGAAAGINWLVVGIALLFVLIVLGAAYMHRKNPTAETAALVEANHAAHSSISWLHSHIESLIAKLEPAKTAAQATPAAVDVPAHQPAAGNAAAVDPVPVPAVASAVSAPTSTQLDAIASKKADYDAALSAAGLPPSP